MVLGAGGWPAQLLGGWGARNKQAEAASAHGRQGRPRSTAAGATETEKRATNDTTGAPTAEREEGGARGGAQRQRRKQTTQQTTQLETATTAKREDGGTRGGAQRDKKARDEVPPGAVWGKKAQKERNQGPPRRSEHPGPNMGRGADQRGGRTKEKERGAALGGLGTAQKKRPMATKPRENGRPTIRGRGATCVAGRARRPEERTKDATNAASPLKSEGAGGHAEDNGPNKHHDKRPDKERGPRAPGRTQTAGARREGRGEKRGGAVWSGAHSAGHHNGTKRGVTTTTTNDHNKRPDNGGGSGLEGRGAAGRTTRHTPRRDATQGTDHAGGAPAPTGKGRGAAAHKRRRGDPAGRKKGAA